MTDHAAVSQARDVSDTFIDQVRQIREQMHQVIVGQDEVIDQLLVCA